MMTDAKDFRAALSAFATGVTVVTTLDGQGGGVGLTANSFTSVSLTPPLILWSLARSSRSLIAFEHCDHFAIHVLARHQRDLSDRFARGGQEKFAGLTLERGPGGIPLLPAYAARFVCRNTYRYDGGDHVIFVGEVVEFDGSAREPLVFHGGRYATASALPAEEELETDIGHLVGEVYFKLLDPVHAIARDNDLALAPRYALSALVSGEQRSLAEINRVIAHTGVAVTEADLDALGRRGLIDRAGGSESITRSGYDLMVRIVATAKAREAQSVIDFDRETIAQLGAALRRMAAAMADRDDTIATRLNALQAL